MNYRPIGFQPVTPWVTNQPAAADPKQRPAGVPSQMPAGAPQMPAAAPAPMQAPFATPAPMQAPMAAPAPTQAPLAAPAPTQAPFAAPLATPAQAPAAAPKPKPAPTAAPAPAAAQAPAAAAAPAAAEKDACIGSQDLDFLRNDIRGELEAINQYWAHIQGSKDPRVKELLCRIMNDEKHHYAEVTRLIRDMDPYQDKQFERVEKEKH